MQVGSEPGCQVEPEATVAPIYSTTDLVQTHGSPPTSSFIPHPHPRHLNTHFFVLIHHFVHSQFFNSVFTLFVPVLVKFLCLSYKMWTIKLLNYHKIEALLCHLVVLELIPPAPSAQTTPQQTQHPQAPLAERCQC